jgi:hypothetical protein
MLGGQFKNEWVYREMQRRREQLFMSSMDGGHQHTISSQGGGEPYPVMPPYYALAFIMKVQ